ncbi:MAG: hypothetical protein J7K77_04525, partial [Dehalococcoidales bacterium]|nr:hypothetical protein [Dehalococcoidales bacterium]
ATRIRSYNPYDSEAEEQQKYLRYVSTDENSLKAIIAIVETRRETNSILRVKLTIIQNEVKDFIASIIAKFLAEKSRR